MSQITSTYCSRTPTPASVPRDQLETAIAIFPRNTQFLSAYLHGELKTSIYGRVQRLIAHLAADDSSIVTLLWSVWAEAMSARSFYDGSSGGVERVRNALDRGITDEKGRRSASMWMLYIDFEVLMNHHQAAKQLCYRSIAEVGGCKGMCTAFENDLFDS
jgi:hypothetical protein